MGYRRNWPSTMRVRFHCYTFPKSDSSYILFDTGAFRTWAYGLFGSMESE